MEDKVKSADAEGIPTPRIVLSEKELEFWDSRAGEINFLLQKIYDSFISGANPGRASAALSMYTFRMGREFEWISKDEVFLDPEA